MPLAYVLAGNWRKPNSVALLMPAVETKYFGIVSYAEESAVLFPQGLPAFEEERGFVLIDAPEGAPLVFLQSLARAGLCFLAFPILVSGLELPTGDCSGGSGRPGTKCGLPARAGNRRQRACAGLCARRIPGDRQFNGAHCTECEDAHAGCRPFAGIPVIRTNIPGSLGRRAGHQGTRPPETAC